MSQIDLHTAHKECSCLTYSWFDNYFDIESELFPHLFIGVCNWHKVFSHCFEILLQFEPVFLDLDIIALV